MREDKSGNAISADGSKYISQYKKEFPNTTIQASGMDGGSAPGADGQQSEVGHLNIGAGRIVYQEFTRISKSILRTATFSKTNEFVGSD